MSKGSYIVIEGLDGSGKTTQFERLLTFFGPRAIGVREPGGTPVGEAVRNLIKDTALARTPRTNLLLFAAARAELVASVIRPAVATGKIVVSDRNWLSSAAYQGAEGAAVEAVIAINRLACEELFTPDLLLFIDTDVTTCQQRLQLRAGQADYFEQKGSDYLQNVRTAYLHQLKQLAHVVIIDGNGTPETVWQRIKQACTS